MPQELNASLNRLLRYRNRLWDEGELLLCEDSNFENNFRQWTKNLKMHTCLQKNQSSDHKPKDQLDIDLFIVKELSEIRKKMRDIVSTLIAISVLISLAANKSSGRSSGSPSSKKLLTKVDGRCFLAFSSKLPFFPPEICSNFNTLVGSHQS